MDTDIDARRNMTSTVMAALLLALTFHFCFLPCMVFTLLNKLQYLVIQLELWEIILERRELFVIEIHVRLLELFICIGQPPPQFLKLPLFIRPTLINDRRKAVVRQLKGIFLYTENTRLVE